MFIFPLSSSKKLRKFPWITVLLIVANIFVFIFTSGKDNYNRKALERHYPGLNVASFENSIDKTVKREIFSYLRECGYVHEQDGRHGGEL